MCSVPCPSTFPFPFRAPDRPRRRLSVGILSGDAPCFTQDPGLTIAIERCSKRPPRQCQRHGHLNPFGECLKRTQPPIIASEAEMFGKAAVRINGGMDTLERSGPRRLDACIGEPHRFRELDKRAHAGIPAASPSPARRNPGRGPAISPDLSAMRSTSARETPSRRAMVSTCRISEDGARSVTVKVSSRRSFTSATSRAHRGDGTTSAHAVPADNASLQRRTRSQPAGRRLEPPTHGSENRTKVLKCHRTEL